MAKGNTLIPFKTAVDDIEQCEVVLQGILANRAAIGMPALLGNTLRATVKNLASISKWMGVKSNGFSYTAFQTTGVAASPPGRKTPARAKKAGTAVG